MKKIRILLLLMTAALITMGCTGAVCEDAAAFRIVPDDEWSWDPGTYNSFEGELDLSAFAGQELTVEMACDIRYSDDTDQKKYPLFTEVDGERITIINQSSTVLYTPDEEEPVMEFSGAVKLPEKVHLNRIAYTVRVLNESGQELAKYTSAMGAGANTGAFYIPYDINSITLYTGIAAAAVWTAALARNIILRKKKRTGE